MLQRYTNGQYVPIILTREMQIEINELPFHTPLIWLLFHKVVWAGKDVEKLESLKTTDANVK